MSLDLVAKVYRDRAEDHRRSAEYFGVDESGHRESVGLLTIHAAIALTDAAVVWLEGTPQKHDDHRNAADHLKRLLGQHDHDQAGISHLSRLLDKKTSVAYGERRLRRDEVQTMMLAMDRYFSFVYRTLPDLSREEGSHDR